MAYTSKTSVIAKGTGKLYLADKAAAGLASDALWTTDPIVSLKGSFKITQAEATVSENFIDQADSPIIQTVKSGKVTVEWSLPNTAKKYWQMFYNEAAGLATMYTAAAGTEAVGITFAHKKVEKMLKAELLGDGQTFIFPNLNWATVFAKESDDDPAVFKISCTVMAEIDSTDPEMIIVTAMDGSAA